MQHMLLMISSEAPVDETAVEPARTPIRKLASPNRMICTQQARVDGKVLSRSDSAMGNCETRLGLTVRNRHLP
jgi:hypothetical protein